MILSDGWCCYDCVTESDQCAAAARRCTQLLLPGTQRCSTETLRLQLELWNFRYLLIYILPPIINKVPTIRSIFSRFLYYRVLSRCAMREWIYEIYYFWRLFTIKHPSNWQQTSIGKEVHPQQLLCWKTWVDSKYLRFFTEAIVGSNVGATFEWQFNI